MQEKVDQDIEQLIQYSIGFADEILHKHGEFYPFASLIKPKGDLVPIAVYSGKQFPESNELIGELETLLKQRRDNQELVAYAIAIDSQITNEQFPQSTDAITIRTYHTQREKQINYYFPYHRLEDGIEIMEGWGEYA